MKRNRYSKELKAKVALEAIKGHKTVNELASEFGVHSSQVNTWKKQAVLLLPEAFGNNKVKQEQSHEPTVSG